MPKNLYTILCLIGIGPDEEPVLAEDVVRFKLQEQDSGALRLDLSSLSSAASRVEIEVLGTTGTTPASGTVLIGESDTTNDDVGVYEGELILIDEIFTPDSSRFWKLDKYQPGKEPPPFDKQFVRNYLLASSWDRKSPPPDLPLDVIASTSRKYREIFRILTGLEP